MDSGNKNTDSDDTVAQASAGRSASRSDPPAVEFESFFSALVRDWRLVLAPVFLALAGLVAYFLIFQPMYAATTQILIVIQKPQIIGSDAEAPGLDLTRYMIGPVIDSQVEILLSTRLAERVIRELGLEDDPKYAETVEGPIDMILEPLRSIFEKTPEGAAQLEEGEDSSQRANGVTSAEDEIVVANDAEEDHVPAIVVARFLERLDVRRKGLTLILQVRFSDEDPVTAAKIANTTAKVYLTDQQDSRREVAQLLTKQLTQRVDELREQLLAKEAQLEDYIAENELASVGGLTVSEREIAETITQLVNARTFAARTKAELEQVEGVSENPSAAASFSRVLDSQIIRDLRRQESEVMRRLAVEISQFGENDPRVVGLRAELGDVKDEISREMQRIVENTRHDYEVAENSIVLLERELAKLTDELADKSQLSIKRAELERDVKATRDLYLALLSRLKESVVQASLLYPDARVIDAASVPRLPSGPRKLVLVAIALFAGLFVGITIAVLRDQTRRTARLNQGHTNRELKAA